MNEESDALVERFLAGDIAARDFTHDMHVKVAWALLKRMPFLEALERCAATIKAMAVREGAPHKFNTTITIAYMSLIDEHMREAPYETWEAFIAANPALMDKALLGRWYGRERLHSPEARASFVMPQARA
jgi:hypothetical protein